MEAAVENEYGLFEAFITLDTPMTPNDAAEKLAEYHGTTVEAVVASFLNLREQLKSTPQVIFKKSLNNSSPYIRMEGQDGQGNFLWASGINTHSGQTQAIIG